MSNAKVIGKRMICSVCGESSYLEPPMPVEVVVKKLKAFSTLHEDCVLDPKPQIHIWGLSTEIDGSTLNERAILEIPGADCILALLDCHAIPYHFKVLYLGCIEILIFKRREGNKLHIQPITIGNHKEIAQEFIKTYNLHQ